MKPGFELTDLYLYNTWTVKITTETTQCNINGTETLSFKTSSHEVSWSKTKPAGVKLLPTLSRQHNCSNLQIQYNNVINSSFLKHILYKIFFAVLCFFIVLCCLYLISSFTAFSVCLLGVVILFFNTVLWCFLNCSSVLLWFCILFYYYYYYRF